MATGPSSGCTWEWRATSSIDEEPHPRWDRFVLEFEGGGRLALRDRRRLGRAVVMPDFSHWDPMPRRSRAAEFRKRIGRGRAPIKARLLDQTAISGVGNLLADEILWQARLHPRRRTGELSTEELDALRRVTRRVIRKAIRGGGAHVGELIPHREEHGHCPRCGTALERATVGGRTTYWCPRDQRVGRVG